MRSFLVFRKHECIVRNYCGWQLLFFFRPKRSLAFTVYKDKSRSLFIEIRRLDESLYWWLIETNSKRDFHNFQVTAIQRIYGFRDLITTIFNRSSWTMINVSVTSHFHSYWFAFKNSWVWEIAGQTVEISWVVTCFRNRDATLILSLQYSRNNTIKN